MLPIIILIAGLANLIMGIIVATGSNNEKGNRSFVLFSFATFIWGVFVFMIYESNYPIMVRFAYMGGSFMITSLLAWSYHYTTANYKKWKSVIIYCVGVIFAIMPFAGGLMVSEIQKNAAGGFDETDGVLFYFYALYILFVYILVIVRLVKAYRSAIGDKKHQTGLILTGISLFVGFSILFVFILPIFGYEKLIDFDVPLSMVFVGFTTYAIARYKWMNVRVIAVQLLSLLIVAMALVNIFNANTSQERIYSIISFIILSALSILLVKSVMTEVRRKEELQVMADKLASANDALRKLDNAKTEFISIASHQLRTPITAIKGFASLLLEGSYGELSEGVHGALEKVYSSSERLVNLIEDLLNVSRIESGRMQFVFEKGSVEKLIKELYDNFLLIAKTKKFYLDMKMPEVPLPEIVMDYSKVRELASNFIDNALKYTEKGGVTVKAELKDEGVVIDENGFVIEGKKSEFGKMVRITVSDTGIGIPKEEIPYLFKKFSRGKDVSRLHVGGTGLGLYVGKAIAEAHHGQVWVESDGAGLGSRFIIEIPVALPKEPSAEPVQNFIESI